MITYIIFLFFLINLIRNYKKWVIITIALCSWLLQFQMLNQNIFIFLLITIFLLFPIKEKFNVQDLKNFPLNLGCCAITISLIITNFSVDSSYRHTPIMLYFIILNYGSLFIFWHIYKQRPQYTAKIFTKTTLIFGFLLSIYCIFEGITKMNPYIDLMNRLELYDSKFYDEVRFGIKRVQGVFSIYTTVAGVSLNLLALAFAYKYRNNTIKTKILIALFFIMLLFSGMRSTILCMIVCILSFIRKKDFKPQYLIPFIFLGIIILMVFQDYFYNYIDSFINTDKVNGSTEDLRITQFEMAFLGLQQSPIWGNGIGYTFTDLIYLYPELRGADSIWMSCMIELGIIGITAYIIFFSSFLKYTYKLNKKLLFYALGVILSQSIASVTSLPIVFVFIYTLVINELLKTKNPKKHFIE